MPVDLLADAPPSQDDQFASAGKKVSQPTDLLAGHPNAPRDLLADNPPPPTPPGGFKPDAPVAAAPTDLATPQSEAIANAAKQRIAAENANPYRDVIGPASPAVQAELTRDAIRDAGIPSATSDQPQQIAQKATERHGALANFSDAAVGSALPPVHPGDVTVPYDANRTSGQLGQLAEGVVPALAAGAVNPVAGAMVAYHQGSSSVEEDTKARLREQHPDWPDTQINQEARKWGVIAGSGQAALSMIPGGRAMSRGASPIVHSMLTGAGFEGIQQAAEHFASGKPFDSAAVRNAGGLGGVFGVAHAIVHAAYQGNPPKETLDALEAAKDDPAKMQAIVSDAQQKLGQAVAAQNADARQSQVRTQPQPTVRHEGEYQPSVARVPEKPAVEVRASLVPSPDSTAPETQANVVNRKPVWEMSPDELQRQIDFERDYENRTIQRIFGADAQAFKRASRTGVGIHDFEDRLTPEQWKEIFAPDRPSVEELQDILNAVGDLDFSSPESLGKSLGHAITDVGQESDPTKMNPKQQLAYSQIRAAMEGMQERGLDEAKVMEAAVEASARRFSDPEDALFMLRRFVRPGATSPELPAPSQPSAPVAGPEPQRELSQAEKGVHWEQRRRELQARIEAGKTVSRNLLAPFLPEPWAVQHLEGRAEPRKPSETAIQNKEDMRALKTALIEKYGPEIGDNQNLADQANASNAPHLLLSDEAAKKLANGDDGTFSADDALQSAERGGLKEPKNIVARLVKRGILRAQSETPNAAQEGNGRENIPAQSVGTGGGGGTEPSGASGGNGSAGEVAKAGTGEEKPKFYEGTNPQQTGVFGQPVTLKNTGTQQGLAFETERKEVPYTPAGQTEADAKAAKINANDKTQGELNLGEPKPLISDEEKAALNAPHAGDLFRDNLKDPSDAAIKDAAAWVKDNGGARNRMDVARKLTDEFGGKALKHSTAVWNELQRPTGEIRGLGGPIMDVAKRATATPFIQNDVKPKTVEAAKGLLDAKDDIQKVFAPQTRSEQARVAGNLVRESAATIAQRYDRAEAALDNARKLFSKAKPEDNYRFIDDVENGRPTGSPATDAIAKTMRDILDSRRKEVQALGKGKLQHFYEDYFPHIWEDPDKAKSVIGQVFGKRPLEGSKGFLKQRSLVTVADGIAAGLKPVSDNPVEMVLLKAREMDRYIMGQRLLQDLKTRGLAKFVKATEKSPDGYARINDGIAQVYGPPTVPVEEHVDRAQWDALQQVAKNLGVTHDRLIKSGMRSKGGRGQVLGFSEQGNDRIVSTFASDLGIVAHEIGHQIDHKYDLDKIVGKHVRELDNLTELRFTNREPDSVSEKEREYNLDPAEQAAQVVEAYVHAPQRMEQVAPNVYKAFDDFVSKHPELSPLKTESSLSYEKLTNQKPHGGLLKFGEYQAPEAVAQVLNNYLSPGLRQKAWYSAINGIGNVMNQAQLGMSAYHLGFTSLDAATSKLALGIDQAMAGHPVDAMKSAAVSPLAPFSNFFKGDKILKEWYSPGTQGSDIAAMADAVRRAGGRVRLDSQYRTDMTKRMMEAFRQGNYSGAAMRAPFAAVEQAAKPILEYIVPRQKLGIFADMARQGIEKLGSNASADDVRAELAKAWDSADNRMGQVVYDNLFWNKMAKDLAMIGVRSVGWNLGTAREIGGGLADFGKVGTDLVRGQKPQWTRRMSYTVALPAMTALVGGILHRAMTGKNPEELKDYFYPQTGGVDENGRPSRVSLPSYMKDIFAIKEHPGKTATDKLHPLISTIADMLQNKDYYNTKIRNEDDPIIKQMLDTAKFVGKQMMPFGVRGYQQQKERGEPFAKRAAAFVGVTPAPSFVDQTDAEKLASSLMEAQRPTGARTQEQADRSKLKHDLSRAVKAGEPDVGQRIGRAVRDGKINRYDAQEIQRQSRQTTLQRQVNGLDSEDAIRVYKVATPDERKQIRQLVGEKVVRSKTLTLQRRQELLKSLVAESP